MFASAAVFASYVRITSKTDVTQPRREDTTFEIHECLEEVSNLSLSHANDSKLPIATFRNTRMYFKGPQNHPWH
jgi:hypothetical protein